MNLTTEELRAVLTVTDMLGSVSRDIATFGDVVVLNVSGQTLGTIKFDGQLEPNGGYVFDPA